MGISDEDYARAAIQLQEMKKEVERQKKEKQMSISGATGLGNLIGGMGQGALQSNGTNPYQQAQAQQAYNSAVTQVSATGTISTGTQYTFNTGINGIKALNEQDLKHDAMLAPLSSLVDLWMARWQGEWVSENEFQEDDFWRLALIRLTGANKLEKHHLASSYYAVYRIIE